MPKEKIFIATLSPINRGGVITMLDYVIDVLKSFNYEIILAYYEPYSVNKALSVPFKEILYKKPGYEKKEYRGCEAYAIGSWLPELEFTHYFPTKIWKDLVKTADLHLVISGNALPGLCFSLTKTPFLAWLGTPYWDDRCDRVKTYPWYRRYFDFFIIQWISRFLENFILERAKVFSVSNYTQEAFYRINKKINTSVLPMPINMDLFMNSRDRVIPWRIGFVGRLNDPRKNLNLLFQATKIILDRGFPITLELVSGDVAILSAQYGFDEKTLITHSYLEKTEVVSTLSTWDLFVIPSFQEGLCVAGLEAMAAGCPVVSTRCGGPESFVKEGVNGGLTGYDPNELADKIISICGDRFQRNKMAEAARKMIYESYNPDIINQKFKVALEKLR